MDENEKLALRLEKLYAKLLGERARLLSPPNYVTRLIPEKLVYAAAASERERDLSRITEVLPHLVGVLSFLNPDFEEALVKPIRPKRTPRNLPHGEIAGAAMDVIRDAELPMATRDIVAIIADRFDLDISTVREKQRYYDAINQAFTRTFRDDVVEHPGDLTNNPDYRRRWSWRHGS